MTSLQRAAALSLAVPVVLLAGAYGSELFGLRPCEMCWWQRWAHAYALPPALAAVVLQSGRLHTVLRGRTDASARVWSLVAAAFILASGVIGAYHAGVEYHWWEGHTACTATNHGASLQDMMRDLERSVEVRCDEAQWTLAGVSLAGWNAIVSTASAVAIAVLALRRRA